MKARLTPRALRDLSDIAAYVRAHSPLGAQKIRSAIVACIDGIARFPGAGRRQALPGVRKAIVRGYPYLIYYRLDETKGEAVVLTIQHAAREREIDDA